MTVATVTLTLLWLAGTARALTLRADAPPTLESLALAAAAEVHAACADAAVGRAACDELAELFATLWRERVGAFARDVELGDAALADGATRGEAAAAHTRLVRGALRDLAGGAAIDAVAHKATESLDQLFMQTFHAHVEAHVRRAPPSEAELRRAAREIGIDEDEMIASYAAIMAGQTATPDGVLDADALRDEDDAYAEADDELEPIVEAAEPADQLMEEL